MKQTIRNIGYATITESGGTITYGTPVYFATVEAGGREYTSTPKGDFQHIYANGELAYSCDNNAGYDISLTLLDLIDDISEEWYGNTLIDAAYKGVAEYGDAPVPPKFALLIHEDTTDGTGKISFYPYCQISARQTDSGKTKEEGAFDFAFSQHSILASPRPSDQLVRFVLEGTEQLTTVPEPTTPAPTPTPGTP